MHWFRVGLVAAACLTAGSALAVPEVKREKGFEKVGHIHGYLVTPAGEGLSGAVSLMTLSGAKTSHHHTLAMRKGRFDIDNLFPGKYRLHVETVGPFINELVPPPDVEVEVLPGKVSRPIVIAATGR